MPALLTHQLFAHDAYNSLPEEIKIKVSLPHLLIHAQSHDYLYYYKSFNFKKTQKINSLGYYAHRANTQCFIINIIRLVQKYKLMHNKEVIAYLYGVVSHYVLDSIFHPYIYYKSGIYKKTKETKKYQGLHTKIEHHLDVYFYQKKYQIAITNIRQNLIPIVTLDEPVVALINDVYKMTYNKPSICTYYQKGIKKIRKNTQHFSKDKTGIKKAISKPISLILYQNSEILANYSYHIKNINPNFLNQNNQYWYHPCTKKGFDYSVDDLYKIAIARFNKIITAINNCLYNGQDHRLLISAIKNISYLTGLPINQNKPIKYFEF